MGVVGRIAAVAEEQDIFLVPRLANRADSRWLRIFVGVLSEPCVNIKFLLLFFILNSIRVDSGACELQKRQLLLLASSWVAWCFGLIRTVKLR